MGLREQAAVHAQRILEDTSGFGWPFVLTSPLGVATSRVGFTTDVGQAIDPETGQAVAGRRASVTVSLRSLSEMPVAVADSSRKPWLVAFLSATGEAAAFKVVDVLPDRALGVVVLLLESYQMAIVQLAASTLVLPRLLLSGTIAPAVSGALVLPKLRLAGSLAPAVSLSGSLALPHLRLAGSLAPAVAVAGSLALPHLALAGSLAPAVSLSGSLTLPHLTLSGSFSVNASKISAMLSLDASSQSAGEWTNWVDLLNSNPGVINSARRPAVAAGASGQPIATFATNDAVSWPLGTGNSDRNKRGYGFWIRFASTAAFQALIYTSDGTGGASNTQLSCALETSRRLNVNTFTGNIVGRQAFSPGNSMPAAGVWAWIRTMHDSSQPSEATICRAWIDGVLQTLTFSNIGAGGTIGTLIAVTGNTIIGNKNNGASPSVPLGGDLGDILYVFNSDLTAAEEAAIMANKRPF